MSVRDEIVTMNIGGCIFSTSLQTLRQDPDSMLARMFSGHELSLTRDAQGNIFIDRDGTHFRYILNYLRSGHVPNLPPAVRKELLIEADFYQIRGLVNALRGSSTGSPDGVDMLEFGPLWLANGTVEAVKQKYGQKYNEIRAAVLQKCKQAMAEGDVRTELYVYDIKQADCPMMDRIFQAVSWELRQSGFRDVRHTKTKYGPDWYYTLQAGWMSPIEDSHQTPYLYERTIRRVEVLNWPAGMGEHY